MTENRRGRLVYLMGPSGSGKDSLLRYAREHIDASAPVVFAHRYITRAADAGDENHIALTLEEFARRERYGLFGMAWQSHGLRYGIGIEIDAWMAAGLTVVVNGSRAYLPQARNRYPRLNPLLIEVTPRLLRKRLQARRRESAIQITARLRRNAELERNLLDSVQVLRNDGALQEAGEDLVTLLQ